MFFINKIKKDNICQSYVDLEYVYMLLIIYVRVNKIFDLLLMYKFINKIYNILEYKIYFMII